ncbi:UPAR/Ly6 domain-containing protein bou-like [Haliotis cracherodii]|uniref:UPAR/Ly6 domain-containing protein bou-like n=2 Tax=Haliotis TaxID=6452 RepID=UPI001EB0959E
MKMGKASISLYGTALVTIVVMSSLISTGSALSCYICNSTLDHNCQEKFNHDSPVALAKKRDCNMWGAKFCIKVTGLWGGIVGTHRFCSSRDLGYQCQDIWYPDHDRMYRACVNTCSADNCNAASQMTVTSLGVVLVGWLLHRLL